jgi:hypothetical protein
MVSKEAIVEMRKHKQELSDKVEKLEQIVKMKGNW